MISKDKKLKYFFRATVVERVQNSFGRYRRLVGTVGRESPVMNDHYVQRRLFYNFILIKHHSEGPGDTPCFLCRPGTCSSTTCGQTHLVNDVTRFITVPKEFLIQQNKKNGLRLNMF